MFKELKRYLLLKLLFPFIYRIGTLRPIKNNKVILVEHNQLNLSNNFWLIKRKLESNYHMQITTHHLHIGHSNKWQYLRNCISLVYDSANTKYIFLTDALNIFGCVPIRKGSYFIQLWHACGAFKKWGFSTAGMPGGDDYRILEKYPNYLYNSIFTVSSPDVIWAYSEATGLPKNKILPLGNSRTDLLFDVDFIHMAHQKFKKLVPNTDNKKIILYAPTFRGKPASAYAPKLLDLDTCYSKLSEDYILIIKQHPLVKVKPEIDNLYQNFVIDLSDKMDIEELLVVADLCITDYSSLIFDYSLLEKPMLFFAYDLDEYFDWRGFYYKYNELTPGPVCRTTNEIIESIQTFRWSFYHQRVIDFKEKFMSACNGHSTDQIIDYIFNQDI